MGGLGQYLEEEGLATTQISLIREHTEKIKPPRALWVPFELGRPLGVPGDPAFQARVVEAALRLLERPSGPIIEDFPEEAPAVADHTGWACPLDLAPAKDGDAGWSAALRREMAALRPDYERYLARSGRTTVGGSGLSPEQAAAHVIAFVEGRSPSASRGDITAGHLLKLATDDLRAFYAEAALGRSGASTSARLADWFWGETAAGRLFLALQPLCAASEDPDLRALGQLTLVPRAQMHRLAE